MAIEQFQNGESLASVRTKLNANDAELNSRVAAVETTITGVYTKPLAGIPESDLATPLTSKINAAKALPGANTDITSLGGITGGVTEVDFIKFDTTPETTSLTPGSVYWDSAENAQTLAIVMAGSAGTTLQVGQEQYYRIKASTAITDAQVVMYVGTQGNSGLILGAPAAGIPVTRPEHVLGVATENIALNATGYVTRFGLVRSVNTTGASQGETWVDGDELYYNPLVVGGLTKVRPVAPNPIVTIGNVVNAAASGSIFVRVYHGSTFGYSDGNVQITSPQNNDFVVYDSSQSRWENYSAANSRTALGLGTAATTAATAYATAAQGLKADTALQKATGDHLSVVASRYKSKHRAGLSYLNIIGDSWANGNGSSVGSKSFAGILGTRYSTAFRVSNYGYSGRPISGYQQAPRVTGANQTNAALIQTAIDDITVGIFGLNDLNGIDVNAGNTGCGSNPVNFPNLITRVQAVATWFMVPESSRVRMHTLTNSGPNPAVTFNGTWTHTGFQGNPNFSFGGGANGDYVQLTTTPGNLLVIRHATINGAGTMRVTVDGVDVLDRSIQSQYENFFVIDSTIVKLPTNGAHTVRLTAVGATLLMVDSVDCVDTTTDFSATLLYSPPTYLTVPGWAATLNSPNSSTVAGATGATAWLYDNGGCDRFGGVVRQAMTGLYELGFNVAELPIRQGFNPNYMTSVGDPLHPNDQGHWHIGNRMVHDIDRLVAGV